MRYIHTERLLVHKWTLTAKSTLFQGIIDPKQTVSFCSFVPARLNESHDSSSKLLDFFCDALDNRVSEYLGLSFHPTTRQRFVGKITARDA